jgi:cysteine desulfurase / selenocysteine lyase
MNTSDPSKITELITNADSIPSTSSAGLPDVSLVTQWANEFFRSASATSAVPVSPPRTGAAVPTEAQLAALPATLSAAPSAAAIPAIPRDVSSLGFLDEIRTLLPAATSGPIRMAAPADLAGRQIPGVRGFSPIAPASLNFLDEANSLDPLVSAPTFSPISSDLQSIRFADISSEPFDVGAVRRDFPILQEKINGRQLVWLDNAATTHKPQSVIDRLSYFYAHENSNIHRAAHTLAARATDAYEAAREKVRRFLNASSTGEIIFVRGATEAINLVAQSWGRRNVQKDDEIVITWLEHHANIVPWQMLCAEKGAKLRVAPVDDRGQVLLDEYEKLLNPRTRLVSFAHVSNALGTITPVEEMIDAAHRHGAKVLVDGAQAVSHLRVDVQAYDCDFYVFSGHKVFAPTGIGVVYGKADVLDATPPWQGGGNMITDVTFEKTQYQAPPGRFEAGTGSIGDAVGLGAAIDYLDRIGMANISRYEHDLLIYATEAMQRIPGLRLIGAAAEKASVLSFVLDGFRTEDVGAALNQEGIAVRSGHHCAQPVLRRFGVESTVRPSLAVYNTCDDIDAMINAIWNLKSGRHSGLA